MTERRAMTLTPADIEAIKAAFSHQECSAFTQEEVQFVRDLLDTMKTAKHESIKWVIRGILLCIGFICIFIVAGKAGHFGPFVKFLME